MPRKSPNSETQTSVLIKSRRRCCICFGLNRDTELKVGQIAHLDHDNSNSIEDNLAFLCLVHHDEYDSRTSQRKGLTIGEVKRFRAELYAAVGKAFSMDVHFGAITIPKEDPYAGNYIRLGGEPGSAEITLTPLDDGPDGTPRYAVTGSALWGMNREYGPNIGDLSFIGNVEGDVIDHYSDYEWEGQRHHVRLIFSGNRLNIEEENWVGVYGMNVTFIGEYVRV